MAKPWERYQQAAPAKDGPWAKYAKPEWQPKRRTVEDLRAEALPHDPTEGMTGGEKFGAGFGKSFVDTGRGLQQAGTDAVNFLTGGALTDTQARQQGVIDRARDTDAALMDTGAGLAGNVAGYATQILAPGGIARGTMLAGAALPTTLAGNVAQGVVLAGLQPVATGESRAKNAAVGGAFGAGGQLAARGLGAVARTARDAIPAIRKSSQEKAAARVIDSFAADKAALRSGAANPQVIVPGSLPTLAEASGDVGLAGLQRTLANTPEFGNALAARGQANNLARVRAIEGGFGGADDAAADAIRAGRDKAATRILRPIEKLPMATLNKVVAGVGRLAEKHQAAPAVRIAMDAVKAELPNIRTVGDAHAVRQYIGQLIGGQVEGKAGAKLAKRELMTVQGLLDREMRANFPEWGKFLATYKAASREADQVATGAELLATGRAVRTATNDPALTPAAFGRAAGNMDRTVARATGFPRATAARTLTPQQGAIVDEVRRDLERFSRAATDGKAVGSNTMQNAIGGNRLQDQVGPVGAAIVEPISGIALLGLNQMRKAYGQQVAGIVEEAMLDPARAAEILARLPASQRSAIVRKFAQYRPSLSAPVGTTYLNQRPLEIDIVGGTPISEAEARREFGP